MLPINLTHAAERSLSCKQIIHVTHYTPLRIYSPASRVDVASDLLSSINWSALHKPPSDRAGCSGNPPLRQSPTGLRASAVLAVLSLCQARYLYTLIAEADLSDVRVTRT